MNTTSWIIFQNLVEKCAPEKKQTLCHYLSDKDKKMLEENTPCSQNPFEHSLSLDARLKRIHYSWLIAFLEPFCESDKIKILSALDDPQRKKLQTYFQLDDPCIPLNLHAKNYLKQAIFSYLISNEKNFLPLELLPTHPLNPLLDLTKASLQKLVDYLGLHDLASEIKRVIKSEQIKKIQAFLSSEEELHLKTLLKGKETVTFAKLNLDQWDGSEEKLRKILLHRGFNRLGKGLFNCHPSLLWHICHRLDIGRTKILEKFYTDINNDQAHKALINQILDLVQYIQKKGP